MDKIGEIKAAFLALLKVALPNHYELSNAYTIEGNPNVALQQGFGVSVGAGNRENFDVSTKGYSRQFNVVLIRVIGGTELDTAGRQATEGQILSDFKAVCDTIWASPTLGLEAVDTDYESDSGIDFMAADGQKYYATNITFNVRYREM